MAMRNENGMTVGFRWNFCSGTTKETNYLNSAYVRTFLHTTLRAIKTEEKEQILNFSPRRKDDKNIVERGDLQVERPNNGREFFFSNTLMKVYQVPSMFARSSEEKPEYSEQHASFIVLFYEKHMRKRTFAKSQTHKQRLQRRSDVMGLCLMNKIPRVMEELLLNRDSKMRRFCNYFLTLFNQKKLNPFT